MVEGIRYFQKYLLGRKFTHFVDNLACSFMLTSKTTSPRVMRWLVFLQSFSFEVIFKPGKFNVADGISRIPNMEVKCNAMESLEGGEEEGNEVKRVQLLDPSIKTMVKAIVEKNNANLPKNGKFSRSTIKKFSVDEEGILWWTNPKPAKCEQATKLVIPESLTEQMISDYHDLDYSGHYGEWKTYKKLFTKYFWYGM